MRIYQQPSLQEVTEDSTRVWRTTNSVSTIRCLSVMLLTASWVCCWNEKLQLRNSLKLNKNIWGSRMYNWKWNVIKHHLHHFHQYVLHDCASNCFHQDRTPCTCTNIQTLQLLFYPLKQQKNKTRIGIFLSPNIYWPLKYRFSFLVLLVLFMGSLLERERERAIKMTNSYNREAYINQKKI